MVKTITKTNLTLEEYLANPPKQQEWIDGKLIKTKGTTIIHSKIQARLAYLWTSYLINSQIGGEVYTELPCKTTKQGRRPDVAYLTPDLVSMYGNESSLPQSPSLVAEIASPDDSAEDLFAKANEYLASGSQEVWIILPENQRIFIITETETSAFNCQDTISTQKVLQGFQIIVSELLR